MLFATVLKHYVTTNEVLVLGVVTTKDSTNEIGYLEEFLATADLPENIPLKADKGYPSKKNEELLRKKSLKNHILKKAKKHKPLACANLQFPHWEKKFNKRVGKTRFKIEVTFGGIKRWFKGGRARYIRNIKMHTQNLMEAIC